MKIKTLYLSCMCCAITSVTAQHSLSVKRNAYRAADQLVKLQVEFKDPGSSGRNLNWDFRSLQPINEEYSLNYFIPDSSRMDTLCGKEHRTRYYYFQKKDSLWAIGFENSTTLMDYVKPELKLKFPFSYGDTLFSRFHGVGQYSHRLKLEVKGYTRVEADAVGELMLPDFETVKNTLRIHTLRYYTETGRDSIEMMINTYAWYMQGIRYPVFESIKTNLIKKTKKECDHPLDTTVFSTSFYYPPTLQASQVHTDSISEKEEALTGGEAVFTEAELMPNPVQQNLHIRYKLVRPARIWFTVHTNAGVAVCQTAAQDLSEGHHEISINMGHLPTAAYTLFVHVDDMVLQRVVVKK